jgi:hypothetical protein
MLWRSIPLLLLLPLLGCSRHTEKADRETASSFIKELQSVPGHGWTFLSKDEIERQMAAKHVDPVALLQGSISLLQCGEAKARRKATRFLGRLGNPAAIGPLVQTLDDADAELREEACYALQWLQVNGEPAESVLLRLCHQDPSVEVRVAAALALGDARPEVIAALRLGLRSKFPHLRLLAEDQLEERGKLELPLLDDAYEEISPDEYERIKKSSAFRKRRKVQKGDTLYFEALEWVAPASRREPHWYRTKAKDVPSHWLIDLLLKVW